MKELILLMTLACAIMALHCGTDQAGMRDAIGYITGEAEFLLSENTDQPAGIRENGPVKSRNTDKGRDDEKGTHAGTGDQLSGMEKKGVSKTVTNNERASVKKEQYSRGGMNKKSGSGERYESSAGGKKEYATAKKDESITDGAGSDKGMSAEVTKMTTGKKTATLIDKGSERKPSGILVKPRVDEPVVQ